MSDLEKKIRAMYLPPNNEVLILVRFFGARQEMRSLSASIIVGPKTEHIKISTFINGLWHGPSRQALF